MKRIVTYDVKQGNDYSAWYDSVSVTVSFLLR